MGGGGMGGMGGGGMGGGGMGGGGFFNVPVEVVPQVPVDGFVAFDVKDEVPAAPAQANRDAAVPATIAPAAPATITPAVKAAKIPWETLMTARDAKAAWEKYFAGNEPDAAAVRDAVRGLMSGQKFDHVIAMLEAALRHHQGKPWMYEATALAMQAADRPKEEIERAVMSAADFIDNASDLMYLGAYLTRLGLDQRALQIFRQVSQLQPLWPEPYIVGMKTAQRINDVEGIQWATVGILSQGWPANQSEVWKTAQRVARATLETLRTEKRTKEAKQFQAALDAALVRDCAINVRWAGNADIDLLVEEPSGSVCSLRNYRTTGGGVLCGDVSAAEHGAAATGHGQTYVCPKGFSGKYKLLVRRVWGQVIAGKVNVEIITHMGTPKARRMSEMLQLDKGEALVFIDLKGGRRTEKLQDQQVVNAAIGQIAVNQQILAQQIGAVADPNAAAAFAAAQQQQAAAAGNNTNGTTAVPFPVPFFPTGAVGYEPVIITLPEGANFAATAVVSADRRYVRITCVPFFSGIDKVTTFNTSSGATATQSGAAAGGTGGQGYSGTFGSNGSGVN
jgi:hypothetical protein